MLGYEKIKEISAQKGVLDIVVEKDYILDWVLWGISQNDYLKSILVFKGGTALHKMYFSDWRFSEDLDFTTVGQIEKDELSGAIERLCQTVKRQSGIDLRQREIIASGDANSEWSFETKVEYIGPRGQTGNPLPTILLHITNNELIKDQPVKKVLIAPYNDLPSNFSLMTYSLEEILSEKIRTVFHQRCWPRDIYDTWRLLKEINSIIDTENLLNIYNRKSIYRGFSVGIPSNIGERILRIKNQWREGLQRQISNPPGFDTIYPEVIELLKKLFEDNNIIKKGGITMLENTYSIKYKKGDLEIEVQGDKAFVEGKFKELIEMKPASAPKEASVQPSIKPQDETGKKMSLAEFLKTKSPKGHDDKILVFGYFVEKIEGASSFNVDDIKKCYRDAKIPPTKNIPTYTGLLTKDGYVMDAGEKKDNKKAWVLTKSGEEYVETLGIDRE